jgi:hypothetical protein
MTTEGPRRERSGDPSGYLSHPIVTRCWFCSAPNPRGQDTLGGGMQGGGTKISVCAPGEGCKDGRIFHGPQGEPHFPGQDCPICGPADKQRAVHRNGGQASAVIRPARSRRRPPR